MTKVGMRVGAIRNADQNEVHFYGYGVYVGDPIHPTLGFPNPCIKLDTGKIVWGCECWWGAEDKIKASLGDRTIIDVEGSENTIEDQLTEGG